MRVRNALKTAATKALYESLDVRMLLYVGSVIIPDYDIYKRTGYPENIPLTAQHAANQIMNDCVQEDLFINLVELLVSLEKNGYMGRYFTINGIRDLIKQIMAEGYVFEPASGKFIEDTRVIRTMNWGRFRENQSYPVTFVKIDMVGNSKHVNANNKALIDTVYGDFKKIIQAATIKRNGREWFWEGDGGLLAFYYSDAHASAVLAGMDILQRWFQYNLLENPLKSPVLLRMAVHAGNIVYSSDESNLKRNDCLKEINEVESHCTPENALTITQNILPHLDRVLADMFVPLDSQKSWKLLCYQLSLEQA